jgi:hypothetical protein
MTAYELADLLFERSKFNGKEIPSNLDELCCAMLRKQAEKIDKLEMESVYLNKKADGLDLINVFQVREIEQLKNELEDCICQGGHSEAYLKAKGKK